MLFSLISRGLNPLVNLILIYFLSSLFSQELAQNVLLVQMAVYMAAGWCYYSHRQKLFVLYRDGISRRRWGGYWWVSLLLALVISISLINYSNDFNESDLSWFGLFLVIVGLHLNSFSYAKLWSEKKLYLSYLCEALNSIALLVGVFFAYWFGWNLLEVWAFGYFLLTFFVALRVQIFSVFFSLRLSLELLFSWVNSQLIVFVSLFELFLFSAISGEGLVLYRAVMIISMALVAGFTVARQYIAARGELGLGSVYLGCGAVASCMVAIAISVYDFDIYLLSVFYVVMCILQGVVSMAVLKMHADNKTFWVIFPTLLTLLVVYVIFMEWDGGGVEDVFYYKILVVAFNVFVTSVMILIFDVLDRLCKYKLG